jgi:hypothetical protein
MELAFLSSSTTTGLFLICHPERSVRAFVFPPRLLRRADAQSKDLLFAGTVRKGRVPRT